MKLILNEDLFLESKADEQKLIDFAGEGLAKRFFALKSRLKAPENDLYYWLKKPKEELSARLDDLESIKTRKEKENTAREGAELVAENDYYKVYHITTYEASVKYGKNTQWCISGSKRWNNGENGEQYFNDYTAKGVQFYFFIPKTVENEKYAIAYMPQNIRYQIFNETDDEVDSIPYAPEVKGIYSPPKYIDGMKIKGTIIIGSDKNKLSNKVIIPDGITYIGKTAFRHCTNLTQVSIPNSVDGIDQAAFWGCDNLESITFPNSVIHIGEQAFYNCTGLTSVTIPKSVGYIGWDAFGGCDSLKKVIYKGNHNMLDNIIIRDGNDYLINAYKQTTNN